ncbi:transport and Golgi organization protein 1 [Halyomorpha halys]|uniref:transport and Golgi organization protein 1 n=1 Tax=Halyomorpha halys TaxID=286706 RepID=UPI0006D4C7C2|nr:transport and Golgi organization protein 1 [Halyomorpha halys]
MCWLFCVSVLFFTFATSDSTLLDKLSKIKWHCADENCSVPISEGYGLRFYNGDDPLKLNFNENDQFLILGKTNDNSDNYWLVQAGDRKGIVPVQFVKERKVIINRGNQIVTELDLSSIIKPIEAERTVKEEIKPTAPNLVIDGTTLAPYEDDSFSTEVVVEEDSEEVYEPSTPQVNQSPFFGFNNPSSINNNSPETDDNQKTNHTETSEGFAGDKVATSVSDNVNLNETSNSQSFIESSGAENSTNEKTSGAEASQGYNNLAENVNVANLSEESNNQNFAINSEINPANETDTSQVLASGNEVESSSDKVTETFKDETKEGEEKKEKDDLKVEENNLESELTNKDDVNTFNEPHTIAVPQHDERYPKSADQLHDNEKENSTVAEAILNADPYATLPLNEIPKSELPVSSTNAVEDGAVSHSETVVGIEKHSEPAELNLPASPETVPSAKEDTIPQTKTVSGIETPSPMSEFPSESEQKKEDLTVPPPARSDLHVDSLSHPSGSLLSSFAKSVSSDNPSSEVPSPTKFTSNQHISDFDRENIDSVISPQLSFISPDSHPVPQYNTPNISNTYASSNEDLNHNDTVVSEPSSADSVLEKPVSSLVENLAGSDSEQIVVDQQPLNQLHLEQSVPETLPADESVKEGKEREDPLKQQTDEFTDVIQEGDGWFSGISSIMGSFTEMFSKSDIGVDGEEASTASEVPVTFSEKGGSQQSADDMKYCAKESCGQQWKDNSAGDADSKGSEYILAMLGSFSEYQMSFSTVICMVITSVVVLLFSLGYYYLENLKQDTSLVAKINTVSTELFFAQKELASIEEQYQLANENYRRLVSETSQNETAIEELRKELEESKAARGVLEEEIKRLEKEIESLVEEGDEMHRMLSESFSEEERTKSLLANISDLKSVLSDRLKEIVSLTEQLDNEKQEVELLTISLKKSEEKREATEDKLTKVLIDADTKTLAVTKEFEEKITTLERIIEERSLERTNFEKQICELKGTCETLMVEKELAEKELKKAHGVSSGKALSEWLEAKSIRTDFLTIQKEAEKLNEALEEAKNRGALLEEKEKELLSEIDDLNNKYEAAEKDKIEALTKLQVLSNYFKEKEIQLQEELGIKESQWLQKQSEDHTIYEQMRSLREENLSYKAQNDALKKEIIDQEASFKIQIANEEQKAQENWINLRHTERRLKEVQMEAAHLRSRLTAVEANPDALEDKHKSLEMVNGDVSMGAASPPFMLFPPPDYIPPPPLVSPTRPPPLGRLSSPPLTPPAPLSPFDYYPPPPPSPPPPLRVHKPQPREPHRKQKDSQSSNHSSESTEKPIRRGKR